MIARLEGATIVNATPFEPMDVSAYDYQNKFAEPAVVSEPKFVYPYELKRSAIDGEVIVLVQIDQEGKPEKLSILSASSRVFISAAIDGLLNAKWAPAARYGRPERVWFYRRIPFRISDD